LLAVIVIDAGLSSCSASGVLSPVSASVSVTSRSAGAPVSLT
jgi:hypothetical protein